MATKSIREKVMAKIPLATDLQLHVRIIKVAGLELVDLRQYVPSLDSYGRGINVESQHLSRLIEELEALHPHVGVGNGSRAPGEGQGVLPLS